MKRLTVFLLCLVISVGLAGTLRAAEFMNGSFEEGPADVGSFITLSDSDDGVITGWNVDYGSIDLIGTYWTALDGVRSIDLDGNEPGAISQTFDTIPGAWYQVYFEMAGNPDGGTALKVLVASAGAASETFEFDTMAAPQGEMGWTSMSFLFQAEGNQTTLQFASGSADGPYGPALDNVAVVLLNRPFPADSSHPAGAVHANSNMIWPPNNKPVQVVLDGYVVDELSTARDGQGPGVSSAWIMVNDEKIVLKDDSTDLLGEDGAFRVVTDVQARKGAVYNILLYAADTTPEEDGGPNMGLVDATLIKVPHDMSGKDALDALSKKDKGKKKKGRKNRKAKKNR